MRDDASRFEAVGLDGINSCETLRKIRETVAFAVVV